MIVCAEGTGLPAITLDKTGSKCESCPLESLFYIDAGALVSSILQMTLSEPSGSNSCGFLHEIYALVFFSLGLCEQNFAACFLYIDSLGLRLRNPDGYF